MLPAVPGALAPVGAAPAVLHREGAKPPHRRAEPALYHHGQLHPQPAQGAHILHIHLRGEKDPPEAQPPGQGHILRRAEAQLRRGEEWHLRQQGAEDPLQAHVPDQHGVHPGALGAEGETGGPGQIPVVQEDVHGQIDPAAPGMAIADGVLKGGVREIHGIPAAGQLRETQIYGVGPVLHRRHGGFRRGGRREKLHHCHRLRQVVLLQNVILPQLPHLLKYLCYGIMQEITNSL